MDKRFLKLAPHYYISRLNNKIQLFYDKHLRPYGITRSQLQILIALWIENPMNIKQIAAFIDMSPQSVVELVNKLEQKRLVERRLNSTDKRETLITLTEHGLELERNILPVLTSLDTQLNDNEIKSYRVFLDMAAEVAKEL